MSVQVKDCSFYIASDSSIDSSSSDYHTVICSGDTMCIGTHRTIDNADDDGVAGEFCFDNNFVYFCVATNTWKRAALLSWIL